MSSHLPWVSFENYETCEQWYVNYSPEIVKMEKYVSSPTMREIAYFLSHKAYHTATQTNTGSDI